MTIIQSLWRQISTLLAPYADWRNLLDVGIVALVIYQILKLFIHTRASSVLKGFGMLLLLTWLSEVLQLNAMNWIMLQIINTGAVLLVVLFQPEIRRGLDQIGRSRFWSALFLGSREEQNAERDVQELIQALTDLSKRRVGALVVIEGETGLDDIIRSGTRIDAEISAPLIENIFEPNTPLHDGAMIIRKRRIVAAACILPLSDDWSISRELGTRHRAGIGTSESTDSIILIVSEETGIISIARDGRLTRHLDSKSLSALLHEIFMPSEQRSLLQQLAKMKEGRREK